jgi:hypothetical protein
LHTTLIERTETDRMLLAPPLEVEALRRVHEAPSETGVPEPRRVRTVQARRLGFDLWMRAVRGHDHDTVMPAFCARLAVLGGREKPKSTRCSAAGRLGSWYALPGGLDGRSRTSSRCATTSLPTTRRPPTPSSPIFVWPLYV